MKTPPDRKPGFFQVAKTIFFGLLMIGKKETWETGAGARMTPGQIVVGALIGGVALIVLLLALVRIVLKLAAG